MGFLQFVFSKQFLKQLGIAAVVSLLLAVLLHFGLGAYTDHGNSVAVPDFIGVKTKDIEAFADTTEVEYEIVDSIYADDLPRGAVADQEPPAGYRVKRGRKVYLTVNAVMPKQIMMPDLRNLSLRQAKAVLETVGLRLGNLQYVPDIAKNAVIDQRVKGRSIKKGGMVFHGNVVDLVLGDGLSNTRVPVPYLIYRTLSEARERLQKMSLNLATYKIEGEYTDSTKVRVFKQIPPYEADQVLPMGTSFILYLTEDTLNIQYDSTLYSASFLLPDTMIIDDETDYEIEDENEQ